MFLGHQILASVLKLELRILRWGLGSETCSPHPPLHVPRSGLGCNSVNPSYAVHSFTWAVATVRTNAESCCFSLGSPSFGLQLAFQRIQPEVFHKTYRAFLKVCLTDVKYKGSVGVRCKSSTRKEPLPTLVSLGSFIGTNHNVNSRGTAQTVVPVSKERQSHGFILYLVSSVWGRVAWVWLAQN